MIFKVVLEPSDEGGYTALVPSLPGCISEGETVEEAMRNVREAIELYLEPVDEEHPVENGAIKEAFEMLDPVVLRLFKKTRFAEKMQLRKMPTGIGPKCVYVNSVYGVLRIVGELKHHYRDDECFFRGQGRDYSEMRPKLFRNMPKDGMSERLKKLHSCQQAIVDLKKSPARFKGTIGAAVLQHYQFPTHWLDLTDDIHVALYFASIGQHLEYKNQHLGLVYCFKVDRSYELDNKRQEPDGTWDHCWCDLRKALNPLSLRPHAQHGVFLSRPEFKTDNLDLSDRLIASIAFPVERIKEVLDIKRFGRLMFPDKYDHTYKWLKRKKVSRLLSALASIGRTDRESGIATDSAVARKCTRP